MLEIKSNNPNYLAKVVRLKNLRKHSNADRLQCVAVDFNNVITGLDAQDGNLYIYFPLECEINKDYLSYTDSFRDKTLNKNQEKAGFFEMKKNGWGGRVKAVKLRGEKSEGYIVPVHTFDQWLEKDFDWEEWEGKEFDTINDVEICRKFVVRKIGGGLGNRQAKKPKVSKIIEGQFKFHVDTAQLKKNIHRIDPYDTIRISYKYHGTSVVLARVICKKPLKWYEKAAKKIGLNVVDFRYDLVVSSRKVVKNDNMDDAKKHDHFYDTDVWNQIGQFYGDCIEEGISIYGEIVGYTPTGAGIQGLYDYGMKENSCDFFVYRITQTNAAGISYEFTHEQTREYCQKYGLRYVQVFFHGKAKDVYPELDTAEHWNEDFLQKLCEEYLEKDCHICKNKVPAEGIVVLREKLYEYDAFKLKSFRFLEKERDELDKEIVNIEDNQ